MCIGTSSNIYFITEVDLEAEEGVEDSVEEDSAGVLDLELPTMMMILQGK